MNLYTDYLNEQLNANNENRDVNLFFVLTVSEHLFAWRKEDKGWINTSKQIITDNAEIISRGKINCATFDIDFKEFIETSMAEPVCYEGNS